MYDREWVERHLGLVWDPFHTPPNPREPDSAMKHYRSKPVVSRMTPPGMARAEIRRAWENTVKLSRKERVALFLCVFLGDTEEEAGVLEGVSQQAISQRLYRGVGKLVEYLNGTDLELLEEDEDA